MKKAIIYIATLATFYSAIGFAGGHRNVTATGGKFEDSGEACSSAHGAAQAKASGCEQEVSAGRCSCSFSSGFFIGVYQVSDPGYKCSITVKFKECPKEEKTYETSR